MITVHMHAFKALPDGSTEYTDNHKQADGWSTYIRVDTPDDPEQSFDINNEADHETYDAARICAEGLAQNLHCDRDAWEQY
jgi:hypothetical protein